MWLGELNLLNSVLNGACKLPYCLCLVRRIKILEEIFFRLSLSKNEVVNLMSLARVAILLWYD